MTFSTESHPGSSFFSHLYHYFLAWWLDLYFPLPTDQNSVKTGTFSGLAYQVVMLSPVYNMPLDPYFCCCLVTNSCLILRDPVDYILPGSPFPSFPGKNSGVSCHFLLQEIFQTQRLNPSLLDWPADSLPLSHQESPILGFFLIYSINICSIFTP